jgi:hypothetical protein
MVSNIPSAGLQIGVEWHEEKPTQVPISHFDFSDMDSLEDTVRELLKEGKPLGPLFHRLQYDQACEERGAAVRSVLAEILSADKPGLHAWAIAFAANMTTGQTLEDIAERYGQSKQAFQERVEIVSEKLELRKTRTMRSDEAREKMRMCNSRRMKHA